MDDDVEDSKYAGHIAAHIGHLPHDGPPYVTIAVLILINVYGGAWLIKWVLNNMCC